MGVYPKNWRHDLNKHMNGGSNNPPYQLLIFKPFLDPLELVLVAAEGTV